MDSLLLPLGGSAQSDFGAGWNCSAARLSSLCCDSCLRLLNRPLSQVGGKWLRWWMIAAAAVSQIGQFEAEMSSDSFQLQASAALCKAVHCVSAATVANFLVSNDFALSCRYLPQDSRQCLGDRRRAKDMLTHLCCNC